MRPGRRIPGGPVVTLDGPAGSGKSTTAREVAQRLGFRHLDSGSLYRGLTHALLSAGVAPEDWAQLTPGDLESFHVSLEPRDAGFRVLLDGRPIPEGELRSPRVTAAASRVAVLRSVRSRLLGVQREAGALGKVVADGRDMGTVVFPEAEVKVFLTADLGQRARRRLIQEGVPDPQDQEIAAEIQRLDERDQRDIRREASPLKVPEDAVVVDTTRMEFQEQVDAIVRLIQERL